MLRSLFLAASVTTLAAPSASAQEPPRTHAAQPTAPEIRAADLMSRLYVLADDSMMGREAGKRGNAMGTDYIAAELRRIGLAPAGEGGTFFQTIPLAETRLDEGAALSAGGTALALGTDFIPLRPYGDAFPYAPAFQGQSVPVVYGGRLGAQMVRPEDAAGKVVVFAPGLGVDGQPSYRFWREAGLERFTGAAAVAFVSIDISPPELLEFLRQPSMEFGAEEAPAGPRAPAMVLSAAAAKRLFGGGEPATLRPGQAGAPVSGAWRFARGAPEAPARNVVALLRGSDPAVAGQYIVISAHNDHVGFSPEPLDHDSVRAYNRVMRPQGANDDVGMPSNGQWARIEALADSMRRAHGGRRLDSIFNGADDDGSGTVVLLEIAEALAAAPVKPRRSILFVSHTAEESGLLGSQHFVEHPTVPLDSIVAALNMDMVGRGRADDIAGGGPGYVQLIGPRRLSTELGALIDSLNAARAEPMRIDYSFDAPGHPLQRYCRSDHFNYARHGIPITYVSRGYHVDYHQVGDEPQYIDYEGAARVAAFVRDIAVAVADRGRRLMVDRPKQAPDAPCRQ